MMAHKAYKIYKMPNKYQSSGLIPVIKLPQEYLGHSVYELH
jgi:hypothetical protein